MEADYLLGTVEIATAEVVKIEGIKEIVNLKFSIPDAIMRSYKIEISDESYIIDETMHKVKPYFICGSVIVVK